MGSSQSSQQQGDVISEVGRKEHVKPQQPKFPVPTGNEYDAIDKIAAELPSVIDEESKQQVADYKQACNNGKGPMVACFATAEYISLFERKHREAADLYRNVCFRPKQDKSPNGFPIDGTRAYPAGCYNLAKMLMTGKGGVPCDRFEAYQLLDRACRGNHGGACYLQAQTLLTSPGALGDDRIPHDPKKAMDLYQHNCDEFGDSISCYTLAAMLLRGDKIHKQASNVSPQEARGAAPIVQRENEPNRARVPQEDAPYIIRRDPKRAESLLIYACDSGGHVTSCHNLAVMVSTA
jgi:TPR repeat protein